MYKEDIELANLLLGKISELGEKLEQAGEQMKSAQAELDDLRKVREERSEYEDIIFEVADLLEREDLKLESPADTEADEKVASLNKETEDINKELEKYNKLLSVLRERAPQLVAAAEAGSSPEAAAPGGEQEPFGLAPADDAGGAAVPGGQMAGDNPVESEVETQEASPGGGEAAVQELSEAEENEAEENEQSAESAVQSATDVEDEEEKVLARFKLRGLKATKVFARGKRAECIVDATSVLDRIPNYDYYTQKIKEEEARDELVRDIDLLGKQLPATFHVVFNSWHQPGVQFGDNVKIEHGSGEGEGSKAAGDRRMKELVAEITGNLRKAVVVTGDTSFAEEVRGPGVQVIPLSDFFMT
ncbi:hypothetical protein IIA79_00245 [bacterium]|nr:hypothetical protein [bacterium]